LGVSVAAIARELGLRPRLLRLWLKAPRVKPRLRRVTLENTSPSPATVTPTLVTPHGFRIEGLDVAGLVTLLRGLA
jgi:transposase-like protein